VVSADTVTVLEFKTGQPRDAHQAQLATYVEAMRELYAGRRLEGRVIYAERPEPAECALPGVDAIPYNPPRFKGEPA
jgi:hypothetical protein